mgnify:CR=1 FL=1
MRRQSPTRRAEGVFAALDRARRGARTEFGRGYSAIVDPLVEILFDPAILKVFHACGQDMEIFFHAYGRLPQPVFDTQLAAPLLGLPSQPSYASLVQELLGTSLSKSHTRTDWSR